MESFSEGLSPDPRDRALFEKIDRVLSEEALIIEGLNKGIEQGWLTQEEKHSWLNSYVQRRLEEQQEPVKLTSPEIAE
jgi:hypothetical protein